MANTYTLIASNTLGSSAASVTFSSIPNTYTDLVLKCSTRWDGASSDRDINIRFNSDSATNYSVTYITTNGGTTPASGRLSSSTQLSPSSASQGSTTTANTFSSIDIYIPNYNVAINKPISVFSATENNATGNFIVADAGLWRNTSAITSITLEITNFVSGSSFFLYGIKNS